MSSKSSPIKSKDETVVDIEGESESEEEETEMDSELSLLKPPRASKKQWKGLVMVDAFYKPYKNRVEDEKEIYYVPSRKPVPLKEKLKTDHEPRFPELEGHYVGKKIPVSSTNLNILENRLVREGRLDWFGDDGQLVTLPNPLREKPLRMPDLEYEDDDFFDVEYVPATRPDGGEFPLALRRGFQLELDLNHIYFNHHPLFSREHVLTRHLTNLCSRQTSRLQNKISERLLRKLDALRQAVKNLQQSALFGDNGSVSDKEVQWHRLEKYRKEIVETRNQRDEELLLDRQLLQAILNTWKSIKDLREEQGYSNTNHSLAITTEEADYKKEKELWKQEYEREFEERKEEFEEKFAKEMTEYQTKLSEWKQKRRQKKEALKSKRKKSESPDISEEEQPKPESPERFDETEIRLELDKIFENSRRPPGEPKVVVQLLHQNAVTQTKSNKEKNRRSAVEKRRICAKVYLNDKEVGRSPSHPLGSDFTVPLGHIFPIRLLNQLNNIRIQLLEGGTAVSTSVIGEMNLPLPQCNLSIAAASIQTCEFISNTTISHTHSGVGSGHCETLPTLTGGEEQKCLYTNGTLRYRVGWAEDEEGALMAPDENMWANHKSRSALDPLSALNHEGKVDVEKLRQWAKESRLDPNDPQNVNLLQMLKHEPTGDIPTGLFRLDYLQREFDFCTDEEIANNPRFRLLQLREGELQEYRNLRMIPLRENEIPPNVFEHYEKQKEEENRKIASKDWKRGDPFQARGLRFLEQIRATVLRHFYNTQKQKNRADLINEEQFPSISMLGTNLMTLMHQDRPLRPTRKERKKVLLPNVGDEEVKVLVYIERAFDVPLRKDIDTVRPNDESSAQENLQPLVRPLVEVSFQRTVLRTTVADGPHPTWNELLQFTYTPSPSEESGNNHNQSISDCLYFHLYDEVIVDLIDDDRKRDTNIHQRLEKKWLGSLRLPFNTLYMNSRIEGTFKLYSPPVVLGYQREPSFQNFSLNTWDVDTVVDDPQWRKHRRQATYLSLFITVQPPLTPPELFKDKIESQESPKLVKLIEKWQNQTKEKFPNRDVHALALDVNGKSVCVTRFFRPLNPPDLNIDEGKSLLDNMDMIARYVSLIPTLTEGIVFPGASDVWLTCNQFMEILIGRQEVHSVLLVNYFLHLKQNAFLVLGNGVPEGATAYVLTVNPGNKDDCWLWNASTGERFGLRDSFCPLISMWCLMNHENVWANMQSSDSPQLLNINIKSSGWLPLFSRSAQNPDLSSAQPPLLDYQPADTERAKSLQDRIDSAVRSAVIRWRKTSRTNWNRYCCSVLRQLLPKLEKDMSNSKAFTENHMQELQQILGSHKVCGYPINVPYTSMEAVLEAVYATGIHLDETKEVEFAVASYVHPYPGQVIAVWVYAASLIRRR